MEPLRITIRNIDPELWDLLRDVAFENDMTLGDAVNSAIEVWYDGLEEVE